MTGAPKERARGEEDMHCSNSVLLDVTITTVISIDCLISIFSRNFLSFFFRIFVTVSTKRIEWEEEGQHTPITWPCDTMADARG